MLGHGEFDAPVFKVLANNDTGAAPGHQGGIVIPAVLGSYFPRLKGQTSAAEPTLETGVTLELWIESLCVGIVPSRYQYQTWGGERSPERRLTKGFSDWRNAAQVGDVAVFQRSLEDETYYRLYLFKEDSLPDELARAISRVAPMRWGLVSTEWQPIRNEEIEEEEKTLLEAQPQDVQIISERVREERAASHIRRSHSFRGAVMQAYEGKCTVTGDAIFALSGSSSCDAAHIIPVESNGTDVVQNGLALRKDLHWAFDRGLWSISPDRRVEVSQANGVSENPILAAISGQSLNEPLNPHWRPADEAIQWHYENRLLR